MQSEENHTPKQFLEATGRYFTHVTSRDVPWEILNHGGLSPERGLPKAGYATDMTDKELLDTFPCIELM